MNAEAIVQINEFALDKECLNLAADYLYFATRSADLKRDVQELESAKEVAEAELSKKIRDEPNVYGLEKVTEAGISAVVLTRKEYKEAQKKVFEARHQLDVCQAAVSAMEHKKRALTLLVELHGAGWHASVKVSKEGREAVDEQTKRNVRSRHQRTREDGWGDKD